MDSINLLKKYTKHKNAVILNSGNDAIFEALKLVRRVNPKNKILIPDQGGWLTYEKYIVRNGFEVVKLKTNKGVLNLDNLKRDINGAAALLITSFAGYYAEQPLEEISKICKKNQCLLIEDASGSIGDSVLCNGLLSDIIVGSFGKWKIVDYGNYGFISSNFNLKPGIEVNGGLFNKIKNAPNRLNKLLKLNENVKFDLQDYNIFHKEKRGINVITEYHEDVIGYCKRKGYEYVICPKEIRVNEKAISIELKRLEYE